MVSTSLAAGSRQLARRKVLVKRLVCIEDLGDVDVLFTDKTGTLTDGRISFMRAPDVAGVEPLLLGLVCNEAELDAGRPIGGNALDVALWDAPAAGQQATLARYRLLATFRSTTNVGCPRCSSITTRDRWSPRARRKGCWPAADLPAAARRRWTPSSRPATG